MASCDLVEDLAEDLECPVCLEELCQPKVLDCSHVFCASCLHKMIPRNRKIECPLCRKVTTLKEGTRVTDLPGPLIIAHIQEKVTAFLSCGGRSVFSEGRKCGMCARKPGAVAYCAKCALDLCDVCSARHGREEVSRGHSLAAISRLTVCTCRPQAFITAYCRRCTIGLCLPCTEQAHVGHDVISIEDPDLLEESAGVLTCYLSQVSQADRKLTAFVREVKRAAGALEREYGRAKDKMVALRRTRPAKVTADAVRAVERHGAAQQKKVALLEEELSYMRATRDSMVTFIKDIRRRNAPAELVLAATRLPDIHGNAAPVLPLLEVPVINVDVRGRGQKLVSYIRLVADDDDVTSSKTGSGSKLKTGSQKSGSKSRAGDKVTAKQMWETTLGACVHDITWDGATCWASSTDNVITGVDWKGRVGSSVGGGVLDNITGLCVDTRRDVLVVCEWLRGLVLLDRQGALVREIPVPDGYGGKQLWGVTYCPRRDLYLVTDTRNYCVCAVSADTGQLISRVGYVGKGDAEFNDPYYICHRDLGNEECAVIVSDNDNNCVKELSASGAFVRRYGITGGGHGITGEGRLQYPAGVCCDQHGKVIVCDRGNARVLRFWWDAGEKWDVLLTSEQLGRAQPECVAISPDGSRLVVGMVGKEGVVRGYRLT